MSHLRREGTDEHDVKINTNLEYDTPVLFLLKNQDFIEHLGSRIVSALRKSLKAEVMYYKCNKCAVFLITGGATGLL